MFIPIVHDLLVEDMVLLEYCPARSFKEANAWLEKTFHLPSSLPKLPASKEEDLSKGVF